MLNTITTDKTRVMMKATLWRAALISLLYGSLSSNANSSAGIGDPQSDIRNENGHAGEGARGTGTKSSKEVGINVNIGNNRLKRRGLRPNEGSLEMDRLILTSDADYYQDPRSIESKPSRNTQQKAQPRRIFNCGIWNHASKVLFPKFEGELIFLASLHNKTIEHLLEDFHVNENDLLLGHLHKGEACIRGGVLRFPGKHLYLNPEPTDDWIFTPHAKDDPYKIHKAHQQRFKYLPPSNNVYVIGPHHDTERSIQVFPGVQYFYEGKRESDLVKFLDPLHRPINSKKHFMAYVQTHYIGPREHAVAYISRSISKPEFGGKKLHVGAKCQGNPLPLAVRGRLDSYECAPAEGAQLNRIEVIDFHASDEFLNNDNFLRDYRFVLTIENTYREGYVSEKIFNAFLSGAVPVYSGSRQVFELFNRKAFIYYDMNQPDLALDQILYLEKHPEEYEKMLQEPILANGMDTVREFFSLSDEVGDGQLRRRVMEMMGYDPEAN